MGPIFVYANSLDNAETDDAGGAGYAGGYGGESDRAGELDGERERAVGGRHGAGKKENEKWPYDWVKGVGLYAAGGARYGDGQIVLVDPLAPKGSSKKLPNLMVGLTHPDVDPATLRGRRLHLEPGGGRIRLRLPGRAMG